MAFDFSTFGTEAHRGLFFFYLKSETHGMEIEVAANLGEPLFCREKGRAILSIPPSFIFL